MIVGVACVPQAPLLLPDLTGRPAAEVEDIRTAMQAAVCTLTRTGPDEVFVVGAAPDTRVYPPDAPSPAGHLAPSPGRRPVPAALPVPLAIGRSLAAGQSVPWVLQGVASPMPVRECGELGAALADRPRRTALLVVADGSARRGEKAPGHIDARAAEFDARIGRSLGSADPDALLRLDAELCAELLVAGRAAWQVMAAACSQTSWSARVLFTGDPFGVSYWVLTWLRPEADSADVSCCAPQSGTPAGRPRFGTDHRQAAAAAPCPWA